MSYRENFILTQPAPVRNDRTALADLQAEQAQETQVLGHVAQAQAAGIAAAAYCVAFIQGMSEAQTWLSREQVVTLLAAALRGR